jgi:hypothetical protein
MLPKCRINYETKIQERQVDQIESIGDVCPNEAGPDYGKLQFDERRSVAASLSTPLYELK